VKGVRAVLASAWSYRVARCVLAGLFLVAGALKLSDPAAFAATIKAFAILPGEYVDFASLAIPLAEVAAAVGLLCDVKGSLAVITVMLLGFMSVLVYAISIGLDVDCGCYGPGDPEGELFHSLWTSLYRDLGMLALSAFIYFWRLAFSPTLINPLDLIRKSPTAKEDYSCVR